MVRNDNETNTLKYTRKKYREFRIFNKPLTTYLVQLENIIKQHGRRQKNVQRFSSLILFLFLFEIRMKIIIIIINHTTK